MTPSGASAAIASPDAVAREDHGGPAFEIRTPARALVPLVSASPHSGRCYPTEMTVRSALSLHALRRSEDAYVDDLASAAPAWGWPLILARYARAFVDLNRAPLELDAAMFEGEAPRGCLRTPRAAAGLGSAPLVVAEGMDIYADRLSFAEVEARIARVHRPYHAALEALLRDSEARFGCAVLLDWHSMPAAAAAGPNPPEVVIGDLHGRAAAPEVTMRVEAAFRARGYRVARNRPYAGGHVTERHGRPAARRHALQIELRRDLYLDEATLEPAPGYARLKADLAAVCGLLAREPWADLA